MTVPGCRWQVDEYDADGWVTGYLCPELPLDSEVLSDAQAWTTRIRVRDLDGLLSDIWIDRPQPLS